MDETIEEHTKLTLSFMVSQWQSKAQTSSPSTPHPVHYVVETIGLSIVTRRPGNAANCERCASSRLLWNKRDDIDLTTNRNELEENAVTGECISRQPATRLPAHILHNKQQRVGTSESGWAHQLCSINAIIKASIFRSPGLSAMSPKYLY